MEKKSLIKLIVMQLCLLSIVFIMTGCDNGNEPEKAEYTKEDITLRFKNETGAVCYVEIGGYSSYGIAVPATYTWESSIDFPTVLKTEIPIGATEKTITIKDVVVSGKTSTKTHFYMPVFEISVTSEDPKKTGWERFTSQSKDQYTAGTFHIKLEGDKFKIDFIN